MADDGPCGSSKYHRCDLTDGKQINVAFRSFCVCL